MVPLYTFTVKVPVRLANGSNIYEGRVEVYHNGEWGMVCGQGWDINDAQVVCNELGYGNAAAALHNTLYGQGSGKIWFKSVKCAGTEDTITSCYHATRRYHLCAYKNYAGVRCSSGNVVQLIVVEIHMYITSVVTLHIMPLQCF